MGDTIVSHGAAGGGKKAEQQLEPLPSIDLPDPDHAPSVVLAAGTTPPQLARTTPRAPAVTPPPVAATRAERAEVATTAMRRFRAPAHA
ncbi:MAG TPA: hypothetical protein VFP84_09045, partial [Kofleriaceae bacterium]|nr:hypothetical protein [Kofleriaceae bacterium]